MSDQSSLSFEDLDQMTNKHEMIPENFGAMLGGIMVSPFPCYQSVANTNL